MVHVYMVVTVPCTLSTSLLDHVLNVHDSKLRLTFTSCGLFLFILLFLSSSTILLFVFSTCPLLGARKKYQYQVILLLRQDLALVGNCASANCIPLERDVDVYRTITNMQYRGHTRQTTSTDHITGGRSRRVHWDFTTASKKCLNVNEGCPTVPGYNQSPSCLYSLLCPSPS